jgi:tRNA (cmo5U34)-methyltransferase
MNEQLKKQFNEISEKYDQQRPKFIHCFNDFYTICLPVLGRIPSAKRVLDIGAGTGLFSQFVYQYREDLHFTLIDISRDMLSVAKERFAHLPNFEFKELDFSFEPIVEKYDVIISALAIHHLTHEQKAELYQRIFDALNPEGIFINADQVEGRSIWYDKFYKYRWKQVVHASDLDQEAIDRGFERMKHDKFSKLEDQLVMLEEAGFGDVDCIYKNYDFVVFSGKKV